MTQAAYRIRPYPTKEGAPGYRLEKAETYHEGFFGKREAIYWNYVSHDTDRAPLRKIIELVTEPTEYFDANGEPVN